MFGRDTKSLTEIADEKFIEAQRAIQALEAILDKLPGRYYLKFMPGVTKPRHVALIDDFFVPAPTRYDTEYSAGHLEPIVERLFEPQEINALSVIPGFTDDQIAWAMNVVGQTPIQICERGEPELYALENVIPGTLFAQMLRSAFKAAVDGPPTPYPAGVAHNIVTQEWITNSPEVAQTEPVPDDDRDIF